MAKDSKDTRDRFPLDLRGGIRDRIERLRAVPELGFLREMNLSQTLRYFVLQQIEWLEKQFLGKQGVSIASILETQWMDFIPSYRGDLSNRQLIEIKEGRKPADEELIELGGLLTKPDGSKYSTHDLLEIRDRTFPPEQSAKKEREPNGCNR